MLAFICHSVPLRRCAPQGAPRRRHEPRPSNAAPKPERSRGGNRREAVCVVADERRHIALPEALVASLAPPLARDDTRGGECVATQSHLERVLPFLKAECQLKRLRRPDVGVRRLVNRYCKGAISQLTGRAPKRLVFIPSARSLPRRGPAPLQRNPACPSRHSHWPSCGRHIRADCHNRLRTEARPGRGSKRFS